MEYLLIYHFYLEGETAQHLIVKWLNVDEDLNIDTIIFNN